MIYRNKTLLQKKYSSLFFATKPLMQNFFFIFRNKTLIAKPSLQYDQTSPASPMYSCNSTIVAKTCKNAHGCNGESTPWSLHHAVCCGMPFRNRCSVARTAVPSALHGQMRFNTWIGEIKKYGHFIRDRDEGEKWCACPSR